MLVVCISSCTLPNRLVLAPMAGTIDRPFRQLCRHLGAGMVVSGIVTSDVRLQNSRKPRLCLVHNGEDEPRSVQIVGDDPAMPVGATQRGVGPDVQIIDINTDCPVKKVCNRIAGSTLPQDEALVAEILGAIARTVDVPVILKTRTDWDRDNHSGVSIVRFAERAGIQALAVHGRTRVDLYTREAEYETTVATKQAVSIPMFANGDIDSLEKARKITGQTGVDALPVGRAAQERPWTFREIDYYLRTGEHLPAAPFSEVQSILLEHLAELRPFYGEEMGVRIARKHVGRYLATLLGAGEFHAQFNRLQDTDA